MRTLAQLIQAFCYVFIPVIICVRGFYLYETISRLEFRTYAFQLGQVAWTLFLFLIFIQVLARLLQNTFILTATLQKIITFEREITILITWLVFFYVLFTILTIHNVAAAFVSLTNLRSPWSWGTFASFTALLTGLTSNRFSQKILKSYWPLTRNLFYITLFFGSTQIAIARKSVTYLLIIITTYLLLKFILYWQYQRTPQLANSPPL